MQLLIKALHTANDPAVSWADQSRLCLGSEAKHHGFKCYTDCKQKYTTCLKLSSDITFVQLIRICCSCNQGRHDAYLDVVNRMCSVPVLASNMPSSIAADLPGTEHTSAKVSCSVRNSLAIWRMEMATWAMSCLGNIHLPICQQWKPGKKNQ